MIWRARVSRMAGVLGVVSLIACASCRSSTSAVAGGKAERFAVVIGAPEPEGEFQVPRTVPNGDPVFVSPQVLVTEADVAGVEPSQLVGGRAAIELVLKDNAAERMKAHAAEYVDRMLVFVWDDQVVAAPYARGTLSNRLILGVSESLSNDELDAIADYLRTTSSGDGE